MYMHKCCLEDYVADSSTSARRTRRCAGRTAVQAARRARTRRIPVHDAELRRGAQGERRARGAPIHRGRAAPSVGRADHGTADEETNDNYEVTKGRASAMRMRDRVFGRTVAGCGAEWDSVRPWDCGEAVVKSQAAEKRNKERLEALDRQIAAVSRPAAVHRRGERLVREQRQRAPASDQHDDPGAVQQDHRGVPDDPRPGLLPRVDRAPTHPRRREWGPGTPGWNCAVKCDACDPDHGRHVSVRRRVRVRGGGTAPRATARARLLPPRGGEERAGASRARRGR